MKFIDNDHQLITQTVNNYFQGTYHGNSEQLLQAFHQDTHITGNINGDLYDWPLSEFISRVTEKPTSAENGEVYDKKIVFFDRTGDVAMVIASVTVRNLIFTDYITLQKINGTWLIRHKSFTT